MAESCAEVGQKNLGLVPRECRENRKNFSLFYLTLFLVFGTKQMRFSAEQDFCSAQ